MLEELANGVRLVTGQHRVERPSLYKPIFYDLGHFALLFGFIFVANFSLYASSSSMHLG